MNKQYFIVPRCGNCGMSIYGLCVEESNFEIAPSSAIRIVKRLEPSACPNCQLVFNKVEINENEQTIIVRER